MGGRLPGSSYRRLVRTGNCLQLAASGSGQVRCHYGVPNEREITWVECNDGSTQQWPPVGSTSRQPEAIDEITEWESLPFGEHDF